MANILRMWYRRCGVTGARGVTGGGIVASLVTAETTAFSDIFGMFYEGEL